MSSEVVMKLPTIDFRKIGLEQGSTVEWISVRDQVYKALVEYGCFEALFDGVSKERLYEKLKQVFNFLLESKFENSLCISGYTKDNPKFPLQERMVIYHPLTPGVIESFSKDIWPDGDLEFCDMVHSYAKKLSELDEMIRKMVFEKLGMEKYFDEHMKSTSCSIGMFKYKVPKSSEANVGLPPHTDVLITTILSEHQLSGLQIKNKNGQWINVEYSSPDSFLFIANECLSALTNGRLHCPYHRVIMGNEERYSIALAGIPKEGCIIKVPEELIDEDHPLLYKPFDALKYLEFAFSDEHNLRSLKDFCGV